jgi:outer membrane protein OmpA-like peptidoglycan-associated protein
VANQGSSSTGELNARYGAYALQLAQSNLQIAQAAQDRGCVPALDRGRPVDPAAIVTHYANLSQTQSQIAVEIAKRRMAEAQTDNVAREVTLGDMLFEVGKYNLNAQGNQAVAELAVFLKNHPDRSVAINGFTDSIGSLAFNQELSRERANAVKAALVQQGIAASRITTAGHGPSDPVASNDTAEGRQQNRRVAVDISAPSTTGVGSTAPPK